jgi:hypothetical protein
MEACRKWPRVLASNRRDGNVATILPSCLDIRQFGATMENTTFDWPDGDYSLNYRTPEVPTSSSPRASRAGPAAGRADPPSGKHVLPLLRLSGWKVDKQYDKNNPVCIYYDFRWKISQRENIRARHVCSDTDPDLVLVSRPEIEGMIIL